MASDSPHTISVSRDIDAPAADVWALVSDLPRMGEWSPEATGGTWVKGADGPAVGARFKGTNANGRKSWNTDAVVTECEPGHAFVFEISAVGLSVATWAYTFETTDLGCTVTETWTDRRGRIATFFGGPTSGVKERAEHNRAGMVQTLENLATAAER
jgi:uncharacterized protein YndB with AHSA1/START domain